MEEKINMDLRSWAQIFRWHTAPGEILLVLGPYLLGNYNPLMIPVLIIFMWLLHGFSFGVNSLLDTAMGYDKKDPSKQHHPLVSGKISLHDGFNVVLWGYSIVGTLGILITLNSSSPLLGMIAFFVYYIYDLTP